MGMYDTINGEQVKCFPWVYLSGDTVCYSGGDLKGYGTGDEVPYRKPYYNYGKNFIILDIDEFEYWGYEYNIHIIVDGKVKDTLQDTCDGIDWSINENVVGYNGELLNIKSSEDVFNFVKARKEYHEKYDEINKEWDKLFSESLRLMTGIAKLDNDSEEKKSCKKRLKELTELLCEERERKQPLIDLLDEEMSKWIIDTSDIEDLINLGDFIEAYNNREDTKEKCKEIILNSLKADNTLYDRYVEWQGSDEFIKEFKL